MNNHVTAILNIGLDNTGCRSVEQAAKVAFHMIGGIHIANQKIVEVEEPTLVVELFADIAPGRVYEIAETLSQQAIAYYNQQIDYGLLIGPEAYLWDGGKFDPEKFILLDGKPLNTGA